MTADTGTTSTADPQRITKRFILLLAIANFGIWIALLTPVIVTLQLKVSALEPDPARQPVVLSILLVVGSLFGIVTNPIAGRLSDRTTSRFGMRRPWLLAGAVLVLVGTVVLGIAPAVPVVIVGWVVTMIGLNILLAVLVALIPDHVEPAKRGTVSGMMGVGQAFGGLIGSGLAFGLSRASLTLAFVVPGVIALVAVLLVVLVLKDRRLDPADRPAFSFRGFVGSFWVNPRRYPDFGWAWISRFAMFLGIAAVVNYQLFFMQAQLGLPEDVATGLIPVGIGVQTLAIILVSLVCGPLSDRLGHRRIFVLVSAFAGVVGLVLMAFATVVPMYLAAMLLIGIAQGIYFSVDLALVTDVLPNKETDAGRNIGVFNLSNLLPQFLAPAIAPLFLMIPLLSITGLPGQNYTALFLVGAVFAIVSALTIMRVKGAR